VPAHESLSTAGRHGLFILVVAALLWATEAISAYAVGLVVMGLEILLLGGLGREGAEDRWIRYLQPWSSSIVWLLLGGFVLGKAASKTGLDRRIATTVLSAFGPTPSRSLLGLMTVGFVLSMFISNTAAAAMLLAVVAPVVAGLHPGDPLRKGLLLAVPLATNVGGMGTLIGSPPNAIAAGALGGRIEFARWILLGLPPALVLFAVSYVWLLRVHPARDPARSLVLPRPTIGEGERLPAWRSHLVMIVFAVTIALWLTSGWHRTPTPVVSFLPIVAFATTGVLRPHDIRALQWDVLLLVAGGLSLGAAMTETGLATWLVDRLPTAGLGRVALAMGLAFAAALLSNVMSNTAAANVLVPIGIALAPGFEEMIAVPIALAASSAMCLPVSTPPNALAFASGEMASRDFLGIGILVGVLGPLLAVLWCTLMTR
jgi:solute carrier family 13 (sodium-dependent dicarboxylate transporter), member 2/3/5